MIFVVISTAQEKTITLMTWNVENLFDCFDDPQKNDNEFLPDSKKEWTEEKLNQKIDNLIKVLKEVKNGKGPDILAVQEIENIEVLKMLKNRFKAFSGYGIVHYESADPRGIDCALFFNKNKIDSLTSEAISVDVGANSNTRDILLFGGKAGKDKFFVFVNHWPSRIGGEEKTELKRIKAASALINRIDKIKEKNKNARIIAVGDFNDTPLDKSIQEGLGALPDETGKMINLTYPFAQKNEGTYKYNEQWNMLDQVIITKEFLAGNFYIDRASCKILRPDFAIEKGGKKDGAMLPTYQGKKYTAGYSDHFPVIVTFVKKK
ncbi:MAG: endonuclease/exonuclease/phosphatase family protein [Bacteroidia bacterium]|nr:endonuclease/exonuclease/phosphatase family protein [Bacteroidia bacterium]